MDKYISLHPNTRWVVRESIEIQTGFNVGGMNMIFDVCNVNKSWRVGRLKWEIPGESKRFLPKTHFTTPLQGKTIYILQSVAQTLNHLLTISSDNRGGTAGERSPVPSYFFLPLQNKTVIYTFFHSLMFAYSASPKTKSNPMSAERQAKDNSPAKSVGSGGLCSPRLFRTGPGCKMRRSRKELPFTLGDWKAKWGLRLVVPLER